MIGNQKRGASHYRWNEGKRKHSAGYILVKAVGHSRADQHGYVYEHILIAEKALGRCLPEGAEVHHLNEQKSDNANTNLVICQDHAYHALLHRRTRALKYYGSAEAVKCTHCKQWGIPGIGDIKDRGGKHGAYHRSCASKHELAKYYARKGDVK